VVAAAASWSGAGLKRALASAVSFALLSAGAALADGYLQSVRTAEHALSGHTLSGKQLREIADRLSTGTSCTQPEIADDLTSSPPDTADARDRLAALDHALAAPLRPRAGAQARLRALALTSPYNREQPESPGDLLNGVLQSFVARLAAAACGGGLAVLLLVLRWLGAVVAAIAIAFLAVRLVRRYLRRGEEPASRPGDSERLRTAADRFAAADRLAAAGDHGGALRELAGAVATVLAGERAWDLSPLTVREIYADAGRLAELTPLLGGFERAVYGHRPVTPDAYAAAAAAAAPYRDVARKAA
jgi:hypothetical protein